jgi:hypothetical protein
MLYKLIVLLILASTMTGGLALAGQEINGTNLNQEEIANLVATEKSRLNNQSEIMADDPTEEGTPTAEITPTVTVTPIVNEAKCANFQASGHPVAAQIAQQYGVSEAEILNWFCQNMGFGEIELAYAIAAKTGASVTDVFAQRQNGQGWGNIKKENGVRGNPKNQVVPPGKNNRKGPKAKK